MQLEAKALPDALGKRLTASGAEKNGNDNLVERSKKGEHADSCNTGSQLRKGDCPEYPDTARAEAKRLPFEAHVDPPEGRYRREHDKRNCKNSVSYG